MVHVMIIHLDKTKNSKNVTRGGVAQYAQYTTAQPTKLRTGQLLDNFMLHRIDTQC